MKSLILQDSTWNVCSWVVRTFTTQSQVEYGDVRLCRLYRATNVKWHDFIPKTGLEKLGSVSRSIRQPLWVVNWFHSEFSHSVISISQPVAQSINQFLRISCLYSCIITHSFNRDEFFSEAPVASKRLAYKLYKTLLNYNLSIPWCCYF